MGQIISASKHPYIFSSRKINVVHLLFASGKALLYEARKTDGPVARGAVGVLTYHIIGLDMTLAVMFSIPYDYNLYSNKWNVKLYSGQKQADKKMYDDLYDGSQFDGDNGWYDKYLSLGSEHKVLKIRGSMAASGKTVFRLHVMPGKKKND